MVTWGGGQPRSVPCAYRLIVALTTQPPSRSTNGDTSVPPPAKLTRRGALARIRCVSEPRPWRRTPPTEIDPALLRGAGSHPALRYPRRSRGRGIRMRPFLPGGEGFHARSSRHLKGSSL